MKTISKNTYLSLFTGLFAILFFASCNYYSLPPIHYEMSEKTDICTGGIPANETVTYLFKINSKNVAKGLSTNGAGDAWKISNVRIDGLKAQLISGTDFSGIAAIEVGMRKIDQPETEVEVANTVNVPMSGTILELSCSGNSVVDVVHEDMELVVRVQNRSSEGSALCFKLTGGEYLGSAIME